MLSLKPFNIPEKHIGFAKADMEELASKWRAFRQDGLYNTVADFDPKTEVTTHKLVLRRPLPADLERHATSALSNLKNAFDMMVFATCAAINRPIKKFNYPWADTVVGFTAIRNSKTGAVIPQEIWEELGRQAPYKRGDHDSFKHDLARDMATLANTKHTVGLTVDCTISTSSSSISIKKMVGPASFENRHPIWDSVNQEAILQETSGAVDATAQYTVEAHVAFDVAPPLRDIDTGDALNLFLNHAEQSLERFKALAIRMGAT